MTMTIMMSVLLCFGSGINLKLNQNPVLPRFISPCPCLGQGVLQELRGRYFPALSQNAKAHLMP